MPRNCVLRLKLPVHFVVFQYQDVPGEWHVTCIDNGAFGWGPSPEAAFRELVKTFSGQFEETLRSRSIDPFFGSPDPEWVEAYNTGKHPAHDQVAVAFRGVVPLEIKITGNKVRIALGEAELASPLEKQSLQPA